jgi:hypothetical protein
MSTANWKLSQKHRAKLVTLARKLARSGQHEDHQTIIASLEVAGVADARRCLTERPLRAQLDKLCTMAQTTPASACSLAAILAEVREGAR